MTKKITLLGSRGHGRLYLSGLARNGIDIKKIPAYFTIEIDIKSIKKREKSK